MEDSTSITPEVPTRDAEGEGAAAEKTAEDAAMGGEAEEWVRFLDLKIPPEVAFPPCFPFPEEKDGV